MAVQLADESHWNDLVIINAVVYDLCSIRHPATHISPQHVAFMLTHAFSFHIVLY
jgi:hypothetical protein